MAKNEKQKVKVDEACKLFDISPRRYRQIAQDGHAPVPVKNEIVFVEAVRQIVKYYRGLAQGQGSMTLVDERTKLTHKRAEKLELELENMKGNLVSLESVEKVVGTVIAGFKARLLSLPAKLAPVVVELTPAEAQEKIQKAIYDVLEELNQIDYAELKRGKDNLAPDKVKPKAAKKTKGKRVGRPRKSAKSGSKRGAGKVVNK